MSNEATPQPAQKKSYWSLGIRTVLSLFILGYGIIYGFILLSESSSSWQTITDFESLQALATTESGITTVADLPSAYLFTGALLYNQGYQVNLSGSLHKDIHQIYYPLIIPTEAANFVDWMIEKRTKYCISTVVVSHGEEDINDVAYYLSLHHPDSGSSARKTRVKEFIPHSRVLPTEKGTGSILGERAHLMPRSVMGVVTVGKSQLPEMVVKQIESYPFVLSDRVIVIYQNQLPIPLSQPILQLLIAFIILILLGLIPTPTYVRTAVTTPQKTMGEPASTCPACFSVGSMHEWQPTRHLTFWFFRLFPLSTKPSFVQCNSCLVKRSEHAHPKHQQDIASLVPEIQPYVRMIHVAIRMLNEIGQWNQPNEDSLIHFLNKYLPEPLDIKSITAGFVEKALGNNPVRGMVDPNDFANWTMDHRILFISLLYRLCSQPNGIDAELETRIKRFADLLSISKADHWGIRWMYIKNFDIFEQMMQWLQQLENNAYPTGKSVLIHPMNQPEWGVPSLDAMRMFEKELLSSATSLPHSSIQNHIHLSKLDLLYSFNHYLHQLQKK